MKLYLAPITPEDAFKFFCEKKVLEEMFRIKFAFAICVKEEDQIRGVIAMKANGIDCILGHLYTDGTALVGSLLYGAAWRAAKALGYKVIGL